jgi:hypothetical protein
MRACSFAGSVSVLLLVLLTSCAVEPPGTVTERIFSGEATFDQLEYAIQHSPLTDECPAPAIGQILYEFRTFPGEESLGNEGYNVVERVQGITGLSMTSAGDRPQGLFGIRGWPSSTGRVLSCGGLFTIAFREQHEQEGVPISRRPLERVGPVIPDSYDVKMPNRRYEVTRISEYTGSLFPLKVGNELTFSYTALHQSLPNRKDYADVRYQNHMRYSVLSVNKAFRINDKTVPGNVYLIEGEKSGDGDGGISRRDYYYSDALGWVVMEVEYDEGTPAFVMGMTEWNRP